MYDILIVDDSTVMRKIIKRNLNTIGFHFQNLYEASNGKEGLQLLSQHKVDIIFVDLNMPEMGGDEMVISLRQNSKFSEIPIIFISSENRSPRIESLLKENVGIIHKPFTAEELKAQLVCIGCTQIS